MVQPQRTPAGSVVQGQGTVCVQLQTGACPHPAPPGVVVDDAAEAYRISTENGGIGMRPPVTLKDEATGQVGLAEVPAACLL